SGVVGLWVARRRQVQGTNPRVIVLAHPKKVKVDAAVNLERLTASGAPEAAEDSAAWQRVKGGLRGTTLLIDAILGTGLSKPLEGFLLEVVRDLNEGFPGVSVVAVDLPSGVSADTGQLNGECVRADA